MTTEHPITPPPELVQQWWEEADNQLSPYYDYIATQAARWAADQQLEACKEWLEDPNLNVDTYKFHEAMRPKPPSLVEEALEALEQIDGWAVSNMNHLSIHDDLVTGVEAIRAALERLQHLEQESNDN